MGEKYIEPSHRCDIPLKYFHKHNYMKLVLSGSGYMGSQGMALLMSAPPSSMVHVYCPFHQFSFYQTLGFVLVVFHTRLHCGGVIGVKDPALPGRKFGKGCQQEESCKENSANALVNCVAFD